MDDNNSDVEKLCHNLAVLAEQYRNEKQYDVALKYHNESIKKSKKHKLHPSKISLFYGLRAVTFLTIKMFRRALRDLNYSIKLYPYDSIWYDIRASLKIQKKHYRQALKDLDIALSLDSNNHSLYSKRASVYGLIQKPHEAIKNYTIAIKLFQINLDNETQMYELATYFNARGFEYTKIKDYSSALTDFNESIQLAPNQPPSIFNRGQTHMALGSLQNAIVDFSEVLNINPNDADAYYNLGVISSEFEDYHLAKELFELALKYNPKDKLTIKRLKVCNDRLNQR